MTTKFGAGLLFLVVATSALAQEATIPQQIRGTWCRVEREEVRDSNVLVFRRGPCRGDVITHVYTEHGRSQKFSSTHDDCQATSVEPGAHIGWMIALDCSDFSVEQFIYPMQRGRLGLRNVKVEGKN